MISHLPQLGKKSRRPPEVLALELQGLFNQLQVLKPSPINHHQEVMEGLNGAVQFLEQEYSISAREAQKSRPELHVRQTTFSNVHIHKSHAEVV